MNRPFYLAFLLCLVAGDLAAQAWPATPDLRRVGRGQAVPTTELAVVVSAPGESREATLARAAGLARSYTASEGFEACALVCENGQGGTALRLTTNHSQLACRTQRDATGCPAGFSPTQETLHSHPHTDTVWVNPVDAALLGLQRGRRVEVMPHDFSRRDRANGAGYLVTETALLYQDGGGQDKGLLTAEHSH